MTKHKKNFSFFPYIKMLNHDCTFTEEYCFQQPLTTMIKGLILTFPHTKNQQNNMAFRNN